MASAKLTPKRKKLFLAEMARTGNVTLACAAAGWKYRARAYELRQEDPQFAQAWDEAMDHAVDLLEEAARKRAMDGTDRPVYQGGALVGHVREYSDNLTMFLLKAHRPTKFRDNQRIEVSGPNHGPIQFDLSKLTSEELAQLEHLTAKVDPEAAELPGDPD